MTIRHVDVIPAPDSDLCLAFANTRYWRGTPSPTEELSDAEALLGWAARCAGLPPELARRFRPTAALLADALATREAIYRCFATTASGQPPDTEDLAALNAALGQAPTRQRVQPGGWDIGHPSPSASALLAPVLWSAADLLIGNQLARVRRCANPQCGWLFLDASKSGNRRWCSMSACGNRAKAHRHYHRHKDE